MICILSQSTVERSTEEVMQWLLSWGLPCIRINGNDLNGNQPVNFRVDNRGAVASLELNGRTIDPREVKAVWYRRWGASAKLSRQRIFHHNAGTVRHNNQMALQYASLELRTLSEFFFDLFENAIWLGRPETGLMNKLKVLRIATQCGLEVPNTLVANNKLALQAFTEGGRGVITKAISEALTCTMGENLYSAFTETLSLDHLDEYPDYLFPSLVQERLDKEYEVRTFVLDGEFYSMAIFSQASEATKTDFRMYQYEHPNRTVPYRLPKEVEQQLRVLMKRLHLDTGSIDIIRTRDGRYVFLEVNAVGQFGMVSMPCNYYLEQKVALALKRRYEQACAQEAVVA